MRIASISPGSSWQGDAHPGRRRYGIPPGGAFDRESFAVARALSGVGPDALAIEVGPEGAELEGEPTGMSVAGAARAWRGRNRLVLAPTGKGCRTYLFGLASSGASEGDPVHAGAHLERCPTGSWPILHRPDLNLASLASGPFRVIPGAQAKLFDLPYFSRLQFRASPHMDRRGIRLEGQSVGPAQEMVSEPTVVGSIQVTPNGGLLVIGPDGPTIGGYPKIATVIDADLDRLGQVLPGGEISFEWVDLETAQALRLERLHRIEALLDSLRATEQP